MNSCIPIGIWNGSQSWTGRKFPVFPKGGGGGGIPRNKFPIPGQTLYGCKCATVERTGQDRTQIPVFPKGGWGGGGGLHLEINFPSPSRHYMGANTPRWKHNTTQMCAKYPGGGGWWWATTNIEQDNESVLVSLLSVIGMPYSECPWNTLTECMDGVLKSHRRKVVSVEDVTISCWEGWVQVCVSSWSCPAM